MGKSAKRRFERRHEWLLDAWAPGGEYWHWPAPIEPRRTRITEDGDLAEARAAPTEALFARIESETAGGVFHLRCDWAAVRAIEERAAEPDVRARAAALFARGPDEADLTRRLAREFGIESRAWLLSRIEPYLASPRALGRERAGLCMRTAEVLLTVDPQDVRAAGFLVALFDHEDARLGQYAIANAVGILLEASRGGRLYSLRGLRPLHAGLARLQGSKNDEAFVAALPALLFIDHAPALARASALLLDRDTPSPLRMDVARHLVHDPSPYRNLPIVLRWLADGATLRERVDVAASLAPVLPPRWLSRTVARALDDESPSLRDRSRRLFEWLPRARARALIERALLDEPDPYLRRALRVDLRKVAAAAGRPASARKRTPGGRPTRRR